jgi:hypothetical protein
MDAEKLAAIAGLVLSLAFAYVPGLKDWFEGLPKPQWKAAFMAVLTIVAAGVIFGLGCAKWFNVPVTCDQTGIEQLVNAVVAALIGMASGYVTLVRPFKRS